MKKVILLFAVIASAFSAMAQDSVYIYKSNGTVISSVISATDSISFTKPDTNYVNGERTVLINGVRWANRNVATPGTFAANPEDAGLLYQWNSKDGRVATSCTVTGWNSNWYGGYSDPSASDTWATANDPSPTGWRVPTSAEIQTLLNATYVTQTWTTQNSVYGYKFTDKSTGNSIFLPATGYRNYANGNFYSLVSTGFYWSSTAGGVYSAYRLSLNSGCSGGDRTFGYCVRPVAE